ncbi:ABC transporter substrate-binding protein [Altererythrobacter sp. CC-YST694]|uniref:ABC transporter substrate-binding protein n=1 Tax=Altererythrobacter sp. CC-YST694 TaxID=2755038 RepID=UPI001D018D2C|nr:ABC transporter substrate-binding protein [Altererythrobacter sp. CC-YST694]MCB5425616.1 ABC transporter substrate-binding protein [Altererythrobacter sp. CC-YST694]
MVRFTRILALGLALLASACGRSDEGALDIAIIGGKGDPFETSVQLSVAGQHVHAATTEGLVGLDAQGQVIPALADRWIVTDDGKSYIFRLRDGTWPDGSELTGESARNALRRAVQRLSGTALGYDLSQIDQIRAMAGRVVEIRLKGAMPDFLQLLAQPEMGLLYKGRGTGPMGLRKVEESAVLSMLSPEARGLPVVENWQQDVRELRVHGMDVKRAIALFDEGQVDVVLNGRIENLPMVDTGPLSRGTVRLDPAIGLFGLSVRNAQGILGDASGREAISMAIDRTALLAPFNVGGWQPTSRLVAPGLPGDLGTIGERWDGTSLAQRRSTAAGRVATWKSANGGQAPEISVALPSGPGGDVLFQGLSRDMAAIGVTLRRAKKGEKADLELMDIVARYANARWFLNQFNCGLRRGFCSSEADNLVAEAASAPDPDQRAALMAEAEAELTSLDAFIPFGPPVRWSLVRAGVTGFAANAWVFHPLPQLAMIPR